MGNDPSIKLLIAHNTPDYYIKDDILTPIQVGRALKEEKDEETRKRMQEMMIGDDTGENISLKKNAYCELAAVYWAWKNYDKLGSPDYIGLMHYRRAFIFDDRIQRPTVVLSDFAPKYLERLNYSKKQIVSYLNECDFICPRPLVRSGVYKHYKEHHDIEDLDTVLQIIDERYPEYSITAKAYMDSTRIYFFNMFIMPKNMFFEYCAWIFDILFEFEKRVDITNKRLFITERITGIFIQHMINQGRNAKELSTTFIQGVNHIPVILSSDDSYAYQTAITMYSALANAAKKTIYDFFILVPSTFEENSKLLIQRLKILYPATMINFYNMGEAFSKIKMPNTHITLPTYYRLLAPNLFPQYNKMIYLDSDVIVKQDLWELYSTDLEEYYVAGVKAPAYHMYEPAHTEWYINKVGIPSLDHYINAGAIVMNLEKMRKDRLVPEFMELAKTIRPSLDQDILNIACYNAIKILPLKYNNMLAKYVGTDRKLIEVFGQQELTEADSNPVIIHYCDKIKPWDNMKCKYSAIWWEYARNSCYSKEIVSEYLMPLIIRKEKDKKIAGKKIKVSVIIPVYNVEQYIEKCLDTVLDQTLNDLEVICINDGSTDSSYEILKRYEEKDERIKVISKFNSGAGECRNIGLLLARGEFVAFMDPDDYYPSNTILNLLYEKAIANDVMIAGGSFCEDHNGVIKYNYRQELQPYIFKHEEVIRFDEYQFDYGFTRFIYNREFLKENHIKFPSYRRFQDPPFFLNAMLAAEKFYCTPEFSYCYRWGHKSTQWTNEKVVDLLNAINECIKSSKQNQLAKLHYFCVKHINVHYYEAVINVDQVTPEIIYLLKEMNQNIDLELLSQEGIPQDTIYPLKAYTYFLSDKKVIEEIIEQL